jgi:hypothetical protein
MPAEGLTDPRMHREELHLRHVWKVLFPYACACANVSMCGSMWFQMRFHVRFYNCERCRVAALAAGAVPMLHCNFVGWMANGAFTACKTNDAQCDPLPSNTECDLLFPQAYEVTSAARKRA